MGSLQAKADSVRSAVSSTSTCAQGTSTILSDLLLPKPPTPVENVAASSTKGTKTTAAAKSRTAKKPAVKPRNKKVEQENPHDDSEQLSPKERSILATEVINAALKALTEAIKAPVPVRRKDSAKDMVKATSRNTLRRSISLQDSSSQPRSLNRVASSPNISARPHRSSSTASTTFSGHRYTAECARVAFACLRTLAASKIHGMDLPPLQLENGMSVLIGKLIALGLDDLAVKELRIMKRRLDPVEAVKKRGVVKGVSSGSTPQTLAELLDFGKGALTGSKLGLVIITQLQILKVMVSSPKLRDAEAALPILQPSHPSSPTKLLLQAAQTSKPDKIARQLQSLSEILLSLTPSVSPSDDNIALEYRLSVAPHIAVQLQGLALHNRVLWWKLAGHKADESKELFDPLLRCFTAFARRSQSDALETYHLLTRVFQNLNNVLSGSCVANAQAPKRILSAMYRIFGSLALEASLIDQAIAWTQKVQENIDSSVDSDARQCSVVARLVGLNLRKPVVSDDDESLLLTLLEGLERPFKGDMSEIEDLLAEVSAVRRAAISILASGRTTGDEPGPGMREMCETLVFMCPRLSLRYLGNPPDANAATKDVVRYEQRRQFVRKSGTHAIDSALFLVKTLLGSRSLKWELMDSKLQDCLMLVERLTSNSEDNKESSSPSYYVRISNLYFSQYLNMRRDADNPKDSHAIRALKRSIDCVLSRPNHERKAAQLSTKLERMAELFKFSGRYDELFETLLTLRDECINNGALSVVAASAATQSIKTAWGQDDETTLLARTIQSLVKVQFKCLNPEAQSVLYEGVWSDEEKGVVLEHLLQILSTETSKPEAVFVLQTKVFQASLDIYNRKFYPIRRLRILIRILSLDSLQQEQVCSGLSDELSLSRSGYDLEGSNDEGIREYLAHYENLLLMLVELQSAQPDPDTIKNCLALWSSICKKSENLQALEHCVDDIPGLLSQLHLVADYVQMRGLNAVRIAVLRLIVDINEVRTTSSNPNEIVISFTTLGSQWLQLGYSGKAGLALDKAEIYGHENGITSLSLLQLHLAYAEYLLAIGNHNKSEEHLLRAQVLHAADKEYSSKTRQPLTLVQRTLRNQLMSKAYLLYSMLALERGATQTALIHAKLSVRLLRRAWTVTEQYCTQTPQEASSNQSPVEKLAEDVSLLNMSKTEISLGIMKSQPACGSGFWALITPLFQGLFHLSGLYAHHGMFQETLYYAQQALQLVTEVGSEVHMAFAAGSLGSLCMRAGVLDKGSEYLMIAKQSYVSNIKSRETAILAFNLGSMNEHLGEHATAKSDYEDAEAILKILASKDFIDGIDRFVDPADTLEAQVAKLTLTKTKTPAPRRIPARAKASIKRTAPATKASSEVKSIGEECPQLMSLKGTVLRQKARLLMIAENFTDALSLLQEAAEYSTSQIDSVDQGLATAKRLLLQSMEKMSADPVYSVLQESTISFPSIAGQLKENKPGDRLSLVRLSPPRKIQTRKGRANTTRSRSPAPNSFFDELRQAQEVLSEVHSIALLVAPVDLIHTTSALMNSVAILLSAAGGQVTKALAHPGFASCSIESVRTLALRRERKANMVDPQIKTKSDESCWPSIASSDARRLSLGVPHDMSRFQKDYIDIIPKAWTAISISLSDSRSELSITKLQAGHSPFVLRLPLGRQNSVDPDEEVFGFEQGHSELMEIVQLANESAHDARDMHDRDARAAWWEEREGLDARLKDLLENIEKVWLGGFTGIFSQHIRRTDLLARFQKSFHNILDKHLPSRQKTGKRNSNPPITLDPRILDLFIGLGDASAEECDFSEPLTDLIYFVVDVLQFHGELNAYAEIDFDSIVIETHDALRAYHEAVHSSRQDDEGSHTILILDKALHAFPWESLPCMDGLAVSRLSSLGCLRDRILAQSGDIPDGAPHGHYISRNNGSYVLNPGGDLKSTQTAFQKPLQGLSDWHGITKREPTEEEMKTSLESSELFLYFGHGSGAQYIRTREVRKLEKCAVTVLMGCSSGLITEAGDFESYGTPVNYMQAGSPALVAILWDVTDKDIDRFAKRAFEDWGLFEGTEKGKGKGKGKGKERAVESRSLVEAVAQGREACHLRYLTAAAVCVYGVPVYFK